MVRIINNQYLKLQTSSERIELLKRNKSRQGVLDIDLVDDLLQTDLPILEKKWLLWCCDKRSIEIYESFLIGGINRWEPTLAIAGLKEWCLYSDRLFPQDLVNAAASGRGGARLFHALLEAAEFLGPEFLRVLPKDLTNFSDITRALVFRRALQWNHDCEALMYEAERAVAKTMERSYTGKSELVFALSYIARFEQKRLDSFSANPLGSRWWTDLVTSYRQGSLKTSGLEPALQELLKQPPKSTERFFAQLYAIWPPTWMRDQLSESLIADLMAILAERQWPQEVSPHPHPPLSCEFLAGIDPETLKKCMLGIAQQKVTRIWSLVQPLLPIPYSKDIQAHLGESVPAVLRRGTAQLPTRIRSDDRGLFMMKLQGRDKVDAPKKAPWNALAVPARDVTAFVKAGLGLPPAFAHCFFKAIESAGKMRQVVPALSQFLNSEEEHVLSGLATALIGNGTKEAIDLVLRLLEQPKVSYELRIDICGWLSQLDLSEHQSKLRDIHDEILIDPLKISAKDLEIADALKTLMVARDDAISSTTSIPAMSLAKYDKEITGFVPDFDRLEPEVKRTLRTARFILTVTRGQNGIDISPTVDMQYKALEILFRSRFEAFVTSNVVGGHLRQGLDRLGYCRGQSDTTEMFENYITSLEIVRDVPGLSRYKLHKLLQSIAYWRPGKRFALDGLKSFGMFFLVFGRKECKYRLANLADPGFDSDSELFNLFRVLHLYQDIRNRAVHEGLSSAVANDVEALWHMTAQIISHVTKMTDYSGSETRSA